MYEQSAMMGLVKFNHALRTAAARPGMRTCPTCKGTGINPQMLLYVCPKCKGETCVPVRW